MYIVVKRETLSTESEPTKVYPFIAEIYQTHTEAVMVALNMAAFHAELISVKYEADLEKGIFRLVSNYGTTFEYEVKMIEIGEGKYNAH